jgi:hypothetical protein
MPDRRFTVFDSMVLIAAIACSLVITGHELRNLARMTGNIGSVALFRPPLRGRTIEDLARDPSVNWALHDGKRWLNPGSLPGEMTLRWSLFDSNGPGLARRLLDSALITSSGFLVPMAPAILILRLRRPRPSWSDLVRQPGFWACAAPVLAAVCVPALGVYFGIWTVAILPGSVIAAWIALALSRQWRNEKSWVDRAGRLVGVYWIIMLPICIL